MAGLATQEQLLQPPVLWAVEPFPQGPSAGIKAHGLRKGKGPRSPTLAPQGAPDSRPRTAHACP